MEIFCNFSIFMSTVLILFYNIQKVVSSEDECQEGRAKECMSGLETYQGVLGKLMDNETAVTIVCQEFYNTYSCLEKYVKSCSANTKEPVLDPQKIKDLENIMKIVKTIVGKFCAFGLSPQETKINNCIQNHNFEETCKEIAQTRSKELTQEIKDKDQRTITARCRYVKEMHHCMLELMAKNCGKEAAKYIKKSVIGPLSQLEDYKKCNDLLQYETDDSPLCNNEMLNECVSSAERHTSEDQINAARMNKSAIEIVCRDYKKALTCIDAHKRKCSRKNDVYDVSIDMFRTNVNKYCNHEINEDDLRAAECLKRENENLKSQCRDRLQDRLSNKTFESQHKRNRQICNSFREYKECTLEMLRRRCGYLGTQLFENQFLKPLFKKATRSISDCQYSSKSVESSSTKSFHLLSIYFTISVIYFNILIS